MPSIDDLINKLDALERKADSVGIKLNKLALGQAGKGLQGANQELYARNQSIPILADSKSFNKISADFDKTKRAIDYLYDDLHKIAKLSPTQRFNINELQRALTEISSVVNSVISAAHVARGIDPILKNSKTGISGSYLNIQPNDLIPKTLASYLPKGGNEYAGAGAIGVTPGLVARELKNLSTHILHEIGHSLDEVLRTRNVSPNAPRTTAILSREREEFYQPQFFQEHMQPLVNAQRQVFDKEVQRLKSIGFKSGDPDEAIFTRDRANYVANASEIFARNFSSYAQTGQAEIPELQAYMKRIFELIPRDYRKLVQDILKETKQIQSEIYGSSYSPGAGVSKRLKTELSYSQYELQSSVTGEDPSIAEILQGRLSEITKKNVPKQVPVTTPKTQTEGVAPNYLNNYYEAIDRELQSRLITYLTGKATGGTPSPEKVKTLVNQILGGEVAGGRKRVGGGARVSLDSIMIEIEKIIDNTIRQSLEIRKSQYQGWLAKPQGTAKPPFPPARGEILTEAETIAVTSGMKKALVSEATPTEKIAQQKQNVILLQELEKLEKQEATTAIKANRDVASEIQRRNDQMALLVAWAEKQATIDKRASEKIRIPKTPEEVYAQTSEYRGKQLLKEAGKLGFSAENIKKPPYTQLPSEVTTVSFEKVDETTQAVTRAEITVDKYGRTLTRTNKRLLGFTDAIVRNTQEILRWSIGVGLVYGTMYRLQELMKVAIDNETKLADIAVVLGDAQRDVNTIFEEAATVANETGENINAVLETYSLAYRAVGAIQDPVERTNSAIQLLTDSTVLNKLSSLDAATSIDVLAGSLRQLQQPGETAASAFSKGTDLLDKWVAITRRANVDLATLATAFSITSESAENSGVSIAQLNGIIASLAEKIGGLGGRETGNAVRALIGGVYQQQASQVLTQYGIAVQDTAGKMRPFLDISKEIYDLYKAGVISADELNKIGYTLGGGVRRGQQYVAFLSDFERIQELANLQTTAAGSAQEALGRKMETTQTALTKMNNAFQSLAQTLGTKGGVLDSFGGLVSTLTLVVSFLDKVVGKLGSITIPASVLAIAAMVFKGDVGKLRLESISSKVGGFAQGAAMGGMNILPTSRGFREETRTMKKGELVKEFVPTDKARKIGADIGYGFGKYAPGIFLSSIPGILKGLEGDILGAGVSIGGAVVGTILASGNPIGGLIGSVIAETFLNAIENRAPDIDKIVQDILDESTKKTEEGGLKSTTRQVEKLSIQEQLNLLVGEALADAVKRYPVTSPQSGQRMFGEGGTYADKISEEYKQKITKYAQENVPVEVSDELMKSSKYEVERLALIERERELIDDIIEKRKEEMRVLSATGEITPKEQMGMNKVLLGLDASLSKIDLAFGDAFDEINTSINGTEERFNTFTDILLAGTEEQRTEIISAAQEYLNLSAAIDLAVASGQELVKLSTGETIPLDTAITNRDNLGEIFPDYLNLINQEQQLSKIKIPTTVGLDLANMKDYDMLLKKAFEDQDTYFNELILNNILTSEQVEILKTKADDLWADVGEGLPGQLIKGLTDTRFLTEAKDALEDALSSVNIGFQEFDFPLATIEKAVAQASVIGEQWKNLYGYKPEIEEQLVIDSEGMVKPIKADWKITNYLLQQILDTEKKQLDGIYNLPEGAGFYVPYQTLDLAYQKGLNEAAGQSPTGDFEELTNLPPYKVEEDVVKKAYADALKAQVANKALERDKLTEGVYSKPSKNYLPYVSIPGEKLKSMTRGDITKQEPTFWDNIKKLFEDVKNIPWDAGTPAGTGFGLGTGPDFKTLFDGLSSKLSTTFNLNLNSTTTLLVDGRVLAEVVKNYLHEDMVRYENTAGAINRIVAI